VIINKGIGAWSPSALLDMTLVDLYQWYDYAVELLEAEKEANQTPQGD
jgi:hypothetical protein